MVVPPSVDVSPIVVDDDTVLVSAARLVVVSPVVDAAELVTSLLVLLSC